MGDAPADVAIVARAGRGGHPAHLGDRSVSGDNRAMSQLRSESMARACLILDSHERVVGRPLLSVRGSDEARARALYEANVVVLAHGVEPDPIFDYGNLLAQQLFEFPWEELVRLPSRLSAEPMNREERQRLLDAVAQRGFIDDYAGVRISKSGKRFRIAGATVWNLLDAEGARRGQAATFSSWTPV
jgi:MEKHLA domain